MKPIKMKLFQKIPEVEDLRELEGKDFEPGRLFLVGETMIEQKHNKNYGDGVTIYKVVKNDKESMVYIPEQYIIEKENKNA
ncbi:MAG: hypothetical protein ACOCRO_09070 [Halanaerobiales bacterium]